MPGSTADLLLTDRCELYILKRYKNGNAANLIDQRHSESFRSEKRAPSKRTPRSGFIGHIVKILHSELKSKGKSSECIQVGAPTLMHSGNCASGVGVSTERKGKNGTRQKSRIQF